MKFFVIFFLGFITLFSSFKIVAQDTIQWHHSYKLSWEDFQGIPDSSSKYKAVSSPSINYFLSYNKESFSYKVLCHFNKKKSWVKLKDDLLLAHEQGHFDIAEVFARKLRVLFKSYVFNAITIEEDFKKMYEEIKKERDKIDSLYDSETQFSMNKQKQLFWTKKIAQNLKQYEALSFP